VSRTEERLDALESENTRRREREEALVKVMRELLHERVDACSMSIVDESIRAYLKLTPPTPPESGEKEKIHDAR
jgi:hypothetical protein